MKQRKVTKKEVNEPVAEKVEEEKVVEKKEEAEEKKKEMSESEMINTVLIGAFSILFLPLIILFVIYQVCSKKFEMEFSHSLIAGAIGAIATAFIGQLRFVFRIM